MPYVLLADVLAALHLAFVAFVALGGLLALRWRRVVWGHIPAAIWGVLIELNGWVCPLTPLENELRMRGGQGGYEGDFVARYLLPVLYPEGLTRGAQVVLGALALVVNLIVYWRVFHDRRGSMRSRSG